MAFEKAWKWSAVRLLFVCLVLSELCSSFHNGPQRCAYEYTAAGAPCRRRTSGSTHRRHLCSPDNDVNAFWPDSTVVQQDDHEIEEDQEEDELTQVLDSILKVHCTHSEPDFLMPWQKMHQSTSTSSGFVVSSNGEKMIMTNAHSVEWASIIQVQRRGDERKYQAVIVTFANECDLALLKVVDSPVDFWEDLEPLEFGPLPSLQDEVEVLGFPTGGDSLSITQGVVSRIEMQQYTQSSSHLLAIQIDAAINAGNSGGPVINEDLQVIGIAFQGLNEAQNIGYVVPVTVVQHVLHDIQRNGAYTGFCSMGVGLAWLENKAFRRSLGMIDDTRNLSGVMVREVAPTALSKGILLPNDVVLSVDGIPVANDGKIPFRPGERVSIACYIQTKFLGDCVTLQVLRAGEELELEVPVSIPRKLVPPHLENRPPPYLIVAGLVFTTLSVPYMVAGDAWESYVSENMSYLLGFWHKAPERETDQVVVLAQVLAHAENLGYDQFQDLHLVKVNGEKVRSLLHLKQLIDASQDTFLRLEFQPDNQIVVLTSSCLDLVTQEVCEEHSVQRPFFLPQSNSESSGGETKDMDLAEDINVSSD